MKQINLIPYINWKSYSLIITIAFIILLLLNRCNPEPSIVTITVPEKKGTFKTDTIEVQNTVYIPKPYKDRSNEDKLKNDISELNTQLELYKEELDNAIDEYTYANDSLKALLFANAIALREFNQPFEDDFIKIENSGYVFGELKSLTTNYTIKERKVDVEVPQLKYRILVGAGVGSNINFNQPLYKINVGYQNAKGNILRASYLRINNQQFGVIERDFSLFRKF